ncbi:hypothetical protein EON66_08005 [archaeon]|nr:MAG: hypothetical protein EON66_08005 [archaeon]
MPVLKYRGTKEERAALRDKHLPNTCFSSASLTRPMPIFVTSYQTAMQVRAHAHAHARVEASDCHPQSAHKLSHRAFAAVHGCCAQDADFLSRVHWRVLVCDEGHRIKNEKSVFRHILTNYSRYVATSAAT